MHCFHSLKTLKHREFWDQKDFEAKKNNLLLPTVMIEIAISLTRLWISLFRKILVQITELNEAHLSISRGMVTMLLSSKRTISKARWTWAGFDIMSFRRKTTILISTQIKSQKLVLIFVISVSITEADKKANLKIQEEFELQRVLSIYYSI